MNYDIDNNETENAGGSNAFLVGLLAGAAVVAVAGLALAALKVTQRERERRLAGYAAGESDYERRH